MSESFNLQENVRVYTETFSAAANAAGGGTSQRMKGWFLDGFVLSENTINAASTLTIKDTTSGGTIITVPAGTANNDGSFFPRRKNVSAVASEISGSLAAWAIPSTITVEIATNPAAQSVDISFIMSRQTPGA